MGKVKAVSAKYNRNAMLRPKEIPTDMVVIIDTREQQKNPLFLPRPPKGLTVVRDKLDVGDYSIRGFENKFMVEKKNINDLFSSIGSSKENHEQFRARVEKMSHAEFSALIVQASEERLLDWQWFTKVHPATVRGTLAKWEVEFDLHIAYCNSKRDAERWLLDRCVHYFEIKRKP